MEEGASPALPGAAGGGPYPGIRREDREVKCKVLGTEWKMVKLKM